MTSKQNLESVLHFFPIDISSTKQLEIKDLKPDTRIFKVDPKKSPLISDYSDVPNSYVGEPYIIDTISGMRIACHPHIVNKKLEELCLDSATEFVKIMKSMNLLEYPKNLVIVNILRAGPGYRVVETIQEDGKSNQIQTIDIRTKYVETKFGKTGFRSHENMRKAKVVHTEYSRIKDSNVNKISTLLIPDTYASGKSAEVVINDLLDKALKPERIILYGFIAIPALIRLGNLCSKNGIELISFAIGNITGLAHNNYDMPLYGVDESWYSEASKIRLMGSIVDRKTLERYLPFYIAGLDQPGDWSERQSSLPTGKGHERGNIPGHLKNSKQNIESLTEIYSKHFNEEPWYENFCKIASKEFFMLNR